MSNSIFNILIRPGKRLPLVKEWLQTDVWSTSRFASLTPLQYLEKGEEIIKREEDLILRSAPSLYDEIVAESLQTPCITDLMKENSQIAVLILDGLSIREIPQLLQLAKQTNYAVLKSDYGTAALPSDTLNFVEQRIIGKKLGPSQLAGRKELKELGITYHYYDSPTRLFELQAGAPLFLWSSFPDGTYMNYEAKSSLHFEAMLKQFDVIWKNIIMTIPKEYRIIITSDHGYIYFGSGFDSDHKDEFALGYTKNDRFRIAEPTEPYPMESVGLHWIDDKRVGMLRGRMKNRPQGSAANKLYRHGGMSLMEMLTPWIEIQRQ